MDIAFTLLLSLVVFGAILKLVKRQDDLDQKSVNENLKDYFREQWK